MEVADKEERRKSEKGKMRMEELIRGIIKKDDRRKEGRLK